MLADGPLPGDVILHGMVSLENHCPTPGKPNSFIYNTLFSCSDTTAEIVSSFRHYIGQDYTKKLDDVYDICAKIVSFTPGQNVNSEDYGDESITILGEIRTMQPLSADQAGDLDDVVCISASSTVASINNAPPSFIMHVSQFIAGRLPASQTPCDNIAVRAELARCPKWHDPAERLPQHNTIVSVWGSLQCFDTISINGNQNTTCVVDDIEDITYLYNPKREPAEKQSPTQKKKTKLQEKFKSHSHK
ncbi:hypothetical protein EI94DRAFT_1800326 [Lactarius quietus]|nr:hypothetical protein EI94DRAFT_1800326 [Lactarius quietus]